MAGSYADKAPHLGHRALVRGPARARRDTRLPLRAAVAVWLVGAVAGWAVILGVILYFL